MRNITAKLLILMTGLLGLSACASVAPDVQVRAYQQDKERLDQIVEGTVGNWQHAPQAVATQTKDTRKVYFVEFSKEPPSPANLDYLVADEDMPDDMKADMTDRADQESIARTSPRPAPSRPSAENLRRPRLDIPEFEDEESYVEESFETQLSYKQYKVQKNDTLQKISKKFYDSYSKWKPIYEANRDVIANPDVLQPGTDLKIPMK